MICVNRTLSEARIIAPTYIRQVLHTPLWIWN